MYNKPVQVVWLLPAQVPAACKRWNTALQQLLHPSPLQVQRSAAAWHA
jgi:hypothetical protein